MNKILLRKICKYGVYTVLIFLSFLIQCTPGALTFCGVKPLLVFPLCIAIAFFEGEYTSAILAVVGGLLCDFTADTLFGFNSLVMLILTCAAGLMVIYLIRPTIVNVLLVGFGALFIREIVDFIFSYLVWGYEGLPVLFYTRLMPGAIYSAIFTPLFFLLVKWVHHFFEEQSMREVGVL